MWAAFFIVCAVGVLFLVCPGYFLLRIASFPRGYAACMAPIISSALYSVLGILFEKIGIAANPLSIVLAPTSILFLAFCTILKLRGNRADPGEDLPLKSILVFVLVGLAAGMFVFVKSLDGPMSFAEQWDEVHHLNSSWAFAESQVFSFFNGGLYTAAERAGTVPFPSGNFYPSGWHVICALLIQACNVPATIAANALNYLFSSVVMPLSMASLLFTLFDQDDGVIVPGALASVSFAAFPWLLIRWGPVFPNLAAFCTVPASCTLFLWMYRCDKGISRAIMMGLAFFASILGIALLQPNGDFTVAVMMGSFLIQEAMQGRLQRKLGYSSKEPRRLAAILVVLFGILWYIAYKLPFLSAVVNFNWPSYQSPVQAAINYLTLAYVDGFYVTTGITSTAQLVLAVVVVVGIVQAIRGAERHRWLVQSYAFWFIAMVVGTSFEGTLKHLLIGFWYTDFCRIAGAAVLSAIPLAVLGLLRIRERLTERIARRYSQICTTRIVRALTAVFVIIVFFPSYHIGGYADVQTGFGSLRASIEDNYRDGPGMVDPEEAAFLQRVAAIIPHGSIVANNPYDGSVFAYGAYDIHVLYRTASGYGNESEAPCSMTIREDLSRYKSDELVAQAVENLDIDYVLFLKIDTDTQRQFSRNVGDGLNEWRGLYEIDENTPGFTLILENGDMRLYKLDRAA